MDIAGREIPVIWRGRRVLGFVPLPLAERDLTLDSRASARGGVAEVSIACGAEALPDDYGPRARLLLRWQA